MTIAENVKLYALAHVLVGKTNQQAAKACEDGMKTKVAAVSVWRWQNDPELMAKARALLHQVRSGSAPIKPKEPEMSVGTVSELITATMFIEKVTPGTVLYRARFGSNLPNIYIRKDALGSQPYPEEIEVTVRVKK